jgi:autotransporter-associated beta strand protein
MKTKSNPFLRSALLVAATLAVGMTTAAHAATITWGTATNLTGASDVFSVGSLNYGYTESNTAATVNGVTFAAGNSTSSLGGGNVTLTGFDFVDTFSYNDGKFASPYADLIKGGAWSNSAGSGTVTLNNLSTNHLYVTQFWVADYRSYPNARTETLDGAVTLSYLTGNGSATSGKGQYAIGRFTANATSQTINISSNESTQMNAIQLRDITGVWTGATSTNLNSGDSNFNGGSYSTLAGLAAPVTSLCFADTDGFDNSVAAKNNITVAAAGFSAGSLNFQNSSVDYTLQNASGTTGITGATALTKSGSGTLTLSSANTYSGGTTISAGLLVVGNPNALGSAVGTLALGGATAMFDMGSYTGTVGGLSITDGSITGSGGTLNAGAITVGNNSNPSATVDISGITLAGSSFKVQGSGSNGAGAGQFTPVTISSGTLTTTGDLGLGRWAMTIKGDSTVNVGGVIGGGSIVSSADWATLTIQDAAVVTATGGVNGNAEAWQLNLNGGTLNTPSIQASDREIGGAARLVFNGTKVVATTNNGAFVTVGANSGATNSALVGNGGAIFDSAGFNIGIGVNLNPDGSSTGGLTKDGAGTLTLSGTNTYSGATTVMTGTLEIGSNGGFDANTAGGQVTVDSGATIKISTSANNALAFQGSTPAWQVSGTLNITANNANSIPAAGIVLNNGTLTGTGTETTYGSLLAVNGSVNTITAYGATNAISNSNFGIFDGVTVTLDTPQASDALTASTAFFNAASGTTGGLAKTGDGTVTLTGANTYQGNTTVSGGILSLSTAFLANGSTISIAAGAKLALTHGAGDTVDSLFLDGVQVPAGTYGSSAVTAVTLDFVDNDHFDAVGGTGYLIVLNGPPAGSDYDTWGAPYGLTVGSEGGDLDSDGLTNQQEYAFGLIPNSGASVNPILAPLNKSAGTFTYQRRNPSLTGLTSYKILTSTDLVTWTQDATAGQIATAIPSTDNESVVVTLTTPPTAAKFFVRVSAE